MKSPDSPTLTQWRHLAGLTIIAAALALAFIAPFSTDSPPAAPIPPTSAIEWNKNYFLAALPGWVPSGPAQLAADELTLRPPDASSPVLAQPGIHGRVTADGNSAPNITVVLRMYDSLSETSVLTATTDGNGNYLFSNVPTLPTGNTYYVRYGPNSTNPNYVVIWYGQDTTAYTAGQSVAGGDFDIANIPLQSPPPAAARSFPVTFSWTRRNVPADSYRWFMTDPIFADRWSSELLGYVDQLALTGLPAGAAYDQSYWWYMAAYLASDSFGYSYYMRQITFSSSTVTPTATPTPTATSTPTRTPTPTSTPITGWRRVYLPLMLKNY